MTIEHANCLLSSGLGLGFCLLRGGVGLGMARLCCRR
jgi:hypothetical protein